MLYKKALALFLFLTSGVSFCYPQNFNVIDKVIERTKPDIKLPLSEEKYLKIGQEKETESNLVDLSDIVEVVSCDLLCDQRRHSSCSVNLIFSFPAKFQPELYLEIYKKIDDNLQQVEETKIFDLESIPNKHFFFRYPVYIYDTEMLAVKLYAVIDEQKKFFYEKDFKL